MGQGQAGGILDLISGSVNPNNPDPTGVTEDNPPPVQHHLNKIQPTPRGDWKTTPLSGFRVKPGLEAADVELHFLGLQDRVGSGPVEMSRERRFQGRNPGDP
jgi:hypothetical protein